MASPASVSLLGSATVFVVKDVLRSVQHYCEVLGFHTEFTYGEPTFYAGVERDGVLIHLQAASETKRQPGHERCEHRAGRIDGDAEHERQQSKPEHLVDEAARAGKEEQDEQERQMHVALVYRGGVHDASRVSSGGRRV